MKRVSRTLLYGSAAFAIAMAMQPAGFTGDLFGVKGAAAQESGGGHGDGGGGQGGGGQGSGGQGAGQGSGGQGAGGQGAGQGGSGQGAGAGKGAGSGGDQGGKPAWAKEGIPEVELGRLSVARSPDQVFARALDEVVSNWSPSWSALYSMTAEEFASYVTANWGTFTMIDSPLQNLALMEAVLTGALAPSTLGVQPASTVDLAAIFAGVASDKSLAISVDTITALDTIMDLGLTDAQISAVAAKAEAVRSAVSDAHG